jgi:DMSO/TMAO reductase YedYZ molybdopterin-dependent catalytic subunit
VLDRAGVKAGAIQVRFGGLDEPVMDGAPKFLKSLTIDHARDGEVMIAFAMNDEQLPLLNGFPLRLVVPGWCGVYWIKMLNDIEVLDQPDTNYWTVTGYRVPDTPHNTVKPGETGFKMVPVTRNVPRRSSSTSATATACPWRRRPRRGASPLAAIAALPASICRSMAARAGSRPSSVPTRGHTAFGNGRRNSHCLRAAHRL